MNRCSKLSEIQMKVTMKYYYIPIRMTKILKMIILNANKNVDKLHH